MYNIKYSKQADIDIEETISHIAQESITNAMSYLSGYEEKIKLLLSNPYMGVTCKAKLINRDCRILVYHASVNYINKFNQEIK